MAPAKGNIGNAENREGEGGNTSTSKRQNQKHSAGNRAKAGDQRCKSLGCRVGKAPRHRDPGNWSESEPGEQDGECRHVAAPEPD